jgi:ABC-2 type transport system permease protein
MKLSRAWTIATNDFGVFRSKKYTLYSLVSLPLVLAIGLPTFIWLTIQRGTIGYSGILVLLNACAFLFIVLATVLPTVLSSYSFLGEKVEKSLEPLLATPATDEELLLGKSLAALLPSLFASYLGAAAFMTLVDVLTYGMFGYYYFPNPTMAIVLLLAVPLASIFSVEANLIIASLVADLRAAQQLGVIVTVPFGGVFVLAETNFTLVDYTDLLAISVGLLLVDIVLLQLSRVTFRREEILTKWK